MKIEMGSSVLGIDAAEFFPSEKTEERMLPSKRRHSQLDVESDDQDDAGTSLTASQTEGDAAPLTKRARMDQGNVSVIFLQHENHAFLSLIWPAGAKTLGPVNCAFLSLIWPAGAKSLGPLALGKLSWQCLTWKQAVVYSWRSHDSHKPQIIFYGCPMDVWGLWWVCCCW